MKFTKQQTFNKVASHLLTQLEVADNGTHCLYHTRAGLKCAVGCLISDDEYCQDMEGTSVLHIHTTLRSLRAHDYNLLTALQEVHDNASDRNINLSEYWSDELITFAALHKLSTRWITHLLHPQTDLENNHG